MKTKQNKKSSSGLLSRPDEQRSETPTATTEAQPQVAPATPAAEAGGQSRRDPARVLPYVNFKQREENRALSTEKVLDLLRQWLPAAYDLAEVVGKWVWVTFPEQPAEQVRGQLSQFGFHWNNSRKCWQHPCGQFAIPQSRDSGADPRQKYGSRFAADLKAA
jgi:hypothetical protein